LSDFRPAAPEDGVGGGELTIKEMNHPLDIGVVAIIKEKGLKQTAVAQKVGCTAQELSDMLNGRRLIKVYDTVHIAKALSCEIGEIYAAGERSDKSSARRNSNS